MNLAAILGFFLFSLSGLIPSAQSAGQPPSPPSPESATQQSQSATTEPAQSPQDSKPTPPSAPTGQNPATKRRRHKKSDPNCSNSNTPAATNTPQSNLPNAENPTAPPPATPCPTPKKVVRNGGTKEPSIQLVGGGTSGQTEQQRTIDQLTAATTENLKKIEGRQLNPTQQDMVSQIKQFMDQSKTAVAAGDLERGNNLAMKARLLSDELVKP